MSLVQSTFAGFVILGTIVILMIGLNATNAADCTASKSTCAYTIR